MTKFVIVLLIIISLMTCGFVVAQIQVSANTPITHGPILGRLSHNGIGVWVRTQKPTAFTVFCTPESKDGEPIVTRGETAVDSDMTGWAHVTGLQQNTTYTYEIAFPKDNEQTMCGSFTTLPHSDAYRHPELNPEGLFNFSFEFACGNHQGRGTFREKPTFKTMLDQLHDKIHFQIMNGDFLYEVPEREMSPDQWLTNNGLSSHDKPQYMDIIPTIVGVWENYKTYLSRSGNLNAWHRNIPAFFMFDDHDLIDDIKGSGEPGFRDRRSVFRDIGVRAFYHYLGWSNPPILDDQQPVWLGKADVSAGSAVLTDETANFDALDLDQVGTLHIHWGTPTAGVFNGAATADFYDDDTKGHPASGVYEVVRIIDRHRLEISPAPKADGKSISYSIGRINYFKMRISNCDFFVLDTRGMRGDQDIHNPWKKGVSMLGKKQADWLIDETTKSDADFIFVVSSVNFTVPHTAGPLGERFEYLRDKDEAWTSFLEEREKLIHHWDSLDKTVFMLSGDLHNCFAAQVTDNVWEFASGPHTSGNHTIESEGFRPPSGDFTHNGRTINIRWSTYFHPDVPNRNGPTYCVVKVNNAVYNPSRSDDDRWIAYPQPQVIFQYYDGNTGDLKYAEAVAAQ
jgi:alkaline phosphatase D